MRMDAKNRQIIQQLDLNPRMPISRLAKAVRVSQQVADYRVKKLQEQEIIAHFGTILNLSTLGYEQYRVLFQLGSVSDAQKREIIEYLKTHNRIYWAALIGGKWDLLAVVWVKNYEEFEGFLDALFNRFPQVIKDYEALYITYHEFYNHKFLQETKRKTDCIPINLANPGRTILLDTLDQCILKQMKTNCRLSALHVAQSCRTTYKTVQNRVKRLEQNNVIVGYRLFLKSEKQQFRAYLLLVSFQSYGRDAEKKLFRYASSHPLITQSLKLFGRWSLMFHIRVNTEHELQQLIIGMRNSYPIIGDYEIIPIFEDIAIDHFPMSK